MSIVYTHNNLIQLFQNIATAHFQVKGFGVGNTSEIEGIPNKQYPYMWVVPVNSSVQLNDSGEFQTINHIFQIEVFDLVKKDRSNETEVLSDCQSILLDVVKILHNENASFEVINSPTLNPYVEKYGDDVTGWYVEIEISVPFDSNYCDIPSDVFVTPGTSGSTNPINPYLTCSTLGDCPVITSIENELENHETRIEALEAGSGGLDCDDVAACQVIIDIEQDITDINTTISNLPLNPTLAEVLTNNNVTDDIHIQSTNNQSLLALEDGTLLLERRTNTYLSQIAFASASSFKYESLTLPKYGDIYISDGFTKVLHSDLIQLDAPFVNVKQNMFNVYEATDTYYLRLKAEGSTGYPEIVTNKDGLTVISNVGEYFFTRSTNTGSNNILFYTNGRRFDLSATAGGTPNITISQTTGYVGINTTTPSSELHVLGTTTISTLAGTANRMVITSSTGVLSSKTITKEIGLTVDGQGGVISTGSKGFSIPQITGTIISWQIKGDDATTGSIVVDIKRNGTSIVGAGNKPTITAANSASANISGWTSSTITAGDYIEYNVDSASTFTRINLVIKIEETI